MDKRTRFWIGTLGVVGAWLVCLPTAWAQTDPCACGPTDGCSSNFLDVTNFYQGPPPNLNPGLTIAIDKFDASLGVLKKVEYVALVRLISASSTFQNTNVATSCSLTGITFTLNNFVAAPAGVTPVQLFPSGALFDCSVSPINVTLQPFGTAGDTHVQTCSPPEPTAITSDLFDLCSNEAGLAAFVGAGTALFPIGTQASQGQTTDCSNIDPEFASAIRIELTVRYTYCPPAPTILDRKVIKPNGSTAPIVIPILDGSNAGKGCEFVFATALLTDRPEFGTLSPGPGNAITYTPDADFPSGGEDVFCFSVQTDCGCLAEACVEVNEEPLVDCVERNRRQCGSLLLYPEYDNTQGQLTVYTITYGCCDEVSTGIWVEMIFIDSEFCTEENRTIFLTPCDTFTFLTTTQAPPAQRGYMYAFAKNGPSPGATPIVANKLIGNLLQVNSIVGLSYTMNAVSFKGIGDGIFGHTTDVDQDGVRDLDGDEYEEAPDQILIPRFMGQDPTDVGFNSRLILIALSGGSEFNFNGGTTVRFSIFDDNENGNSADYPFYCWTKVRLRDISGAFLQSFLASPIDNPAEIAGAPQREAGWFKIDGRFAHSQQETINDPAIYAVLVEQHFAYVFAAAELPFELCSQDNGDLLPENIFGDPRPGFPSGVLGDNQ